MKKKKALLDFELDFSDDDLDGIAEPFDPLHFSANKFPHIGGFRKPRAPIILAHGIARPDYIIDSLSRTLNLSIYDISFLSDRFHYFRGIASFLRKHGFEVYHTSVSFAAGVEKRARDLKQEILAILDRTQHTQVHIIAHSMGGLDARHMIIDEGMADKVLSLTTIGTPHLGTSAADFIISHGADKVIGRLKRIIDLEGIRSCTTEACRAFNERAGHEEAKNHIFYQTWSSRQTREKTFLPFQLTWKIIAGHEGENDGLVPVSSQKWYDSLRAEDGSFKIIPHHAFPFAADHMDQIGWWNLNEIHKAGWWNMKALRRKNKHELMIKRIYLQIVRDLYERVTSDS